MSKELRIKMMENRIRLLTSRGEGINFRIINKLKRRVRTMENN